MAPQETNELSDEDAINGEDAAGNVRRWLLEHHSGVLGTVSRGEQLEGWPFLSVVPFALDAWGQPLLQLADIAQHTRNVNHDSRASLLVKEPTADADPQRGWRITLLGRLEAVAARHHDEMLARFGERVPAAQAYALQHAFKFYRLTIERVRYIAGFGRICWVPGERVLREPLGAGLQDAEAGAIKHMNADHHSSLLEMCEGLYGFTPERAAITQLDRAGFLVRTHNPERLVHFSFGRETTAGALRRDVIDVLARAHANRFGVAP